MPPETTVIRIKLLSVKGVKGPEEYLRRG